jgi:hypothetical protein
MHRIIYLSASTKELSIEEINALLLQSRKFNTENNITGVLLYIDGDFLQVIEGSEEVTKRLFEKIKEDKRHKGIITVYNDRFLEKQFPDWSMGFGLIDYKKLEKTPGFENFVKKETLTITDKTAMVFIETFIKTHRDKIVYI